MYARLASGLLRAENKPFFREPENTPARFKASRQLHESTIPTMTLLRETFVDGHDLGLIHGEFHGEIILAVHSYVKLEKLAQGNLWGSYVYSSTDYG